MKEKFPPHLGSLHHRVTELQDGPDAPPKEISRRQALITGANAVGFVAAAGYAGTWAHEKAEGGEQASPSKPETSNNEIRTMQIEDGENAQNPDWWKGVWYKTPEALVGKNVDNFLELSYIGSDPDQSIQLVNPKSLPKILPPIAFHKNVFRLIEMKKRILEKTPNSEADLAFFDSLGASYEKLFLSEKIRKMDLKEFRSIIEKESRTVISELKAKRAEIVSAHISMHLDTTGWARGTKERKRYEVVMAHALEIIAENINPDLILAYILTELMPSVEKGLPLFEFVVEHAGVDFLERIPAEGDSQKSFGPFQLTPYVIGREKGSVTHMLSSIHSNLLPESLAEFSSIEEHIRAGVLFAFVNLVKMTQEICKGGHYEELQTFLESSFPVNNSSVFLEFIASAHHRPGSAYAAMSTWLANNKSLPREQREPTLTNSFPDTEIDQGVRVYADRSRAFLRKVQAV